MKTGQKLAIDDWWSRSHRMHKCIESHRCKIVTSFCNINATQMQCQLFTHVFRSQFAISSHHVKLFARLFTARTLVNLVFATRMCATQLQTPAGRLRKHRWPQYVNSPTYNSRSFTVSLSFTLSRRRLGSREESVELWLQSQFSELSCVTARHRLTPPTAEELVPAFGGGQVGGGCLLKGGGGILPLKGRLPHLAGARHKCFSG